MNMFNFMRQLSARLTTMDSSYQAPSASDMARLRFYQKEAQRDVLNVPFQKLPIVVFDLETSGFNPDQGDSILSIGAVKVTGSEVHDEHFYHTVKPKKEPSQAILDLTGLTMRELNQSASISEVLLAFYEFAKSATLVAHHAAHERAFMRHLTWQELGRTFTHRLVDTSFLTSITAQHLEHFETLDEWCAEYEIPMSHRHHALADARMTANLWTKHITMAEHSGFTCLADIYKELATRK